MNSYELVLIYEDGTSYIVPLTPEFAVDPKCMSRLYSQLAPDEDIVTLGDYAFSVKGLRFSYIRKNT